MSRRMFARGLCLLALIALTAGTAGPASAQGGKGKKKAVERPFKGPVVAVWDNVFLALPAPQGAGEASFEGVGHTTGLGLNTQSGTLQLHPVDDGPLIPGDGGDDHRGQRRDSVTFDYTGTLDAATGAGWGTFAFVPELGTGRFNGATGGGTFVAMIDLSTPTAQRMYVQLEGKIKY